MDTAKVRSKAAVEKNRVAVDDRPIHDWYRFVLSYPPHLVGNYLQKLGVVAGQTVLDPFCGTGTTPVECKKRGITSVGIEANPMAHFACRVKLNWNVASRTLISEAERIADSVRRNLLRNGVVDASDLPLPAGRQKKLHVSPYCTLSPEQMKLLLTNSISPLPLHKTLLLRDTIRGEARPLVREHLSLALAKAVVFSISNLHFGPEVGVTKPKHDAAVLDSWLREVRNMAEDLAEWRPKREASAVVHHADSREVSDLLEPASIDAVITSPPYPNEKDYTRTTRLESVLLGFLSSREELRQLKRGMLRSNTRGVYRLDDDDQWVVDHPEVQRIAREIEERRIELKKTSGFERMYHRVTKLYFGGMAKHFAALQTKLRPGAKLAYVVGDQASYLRIMIRTGTILADNAESQGYRVLGIDLFRTRLATATREQLREEVVLLEWPGKTRRGANGKKK